MRSGPATRLLVVASEGLLASKLWLYYKAKMTTGHSAGQSGGHKEPFEPWRISTQERRRCFYSPGASNSDSQQDLQISVLPAPLWSPEEVIESEFPSEEAQAATIFYRICLYIYRYISMETRSKTPCDPETGVEPRSREWGRGKLGDSMVAGTGVGGGDWREDRAAGGCTPFPSLSTLKPPFGSLSSVTGWCRGD